MHLFTSPPLLWIKDDQIKHVGETQKYAEWTVLQQYNIIGVHTKGLFLHIITLILNTLS